MQKGYLLKSCQAVFLRGFLGFLSGAFLFKRGVQKGYLGSPARRWFLRGFFRVPVRRVPFKGVYESVAKRGFEVLPGGVCRV